MAAYLGPDISLEHFLLAPPHSLRAQARAPRESPDAQLNADGFGFGWFDRDGRPCTYVNPAPIWHDPNLPALGRGLVAPLWLGLVRSATAGSGISHANTQPFADAELLFLHNGLLRDFHDQFRPAISADLGPEPAGGIHGNTDSEYLFALLRQILAEDADLALETALAELCARVDEWSEGTPALLNFLVSENGRLYAVRHACNDSCPSLYYSTDDERFPGAQLVASEPLDETGFWQPVPEHHILILDPEEPPELMEL
ncbi:class II glutamine amidotransferase [Oceanibaculum nanhaiense]|uniref:class II glutamine amidotransferase n=1 Tax=Oceanibaculum nanhaiense TaxID=1909734 RepID=UPI00396D9551